MMGTLNGFLCALRLRFWSCLDSVFLIYVRLVLWYQSYMMVRGLYRSGLLKIDLMEREGEEK